MYRDTVHVKKDHDDRFEFIGVICLYAVTACNA